MIISNIADWSDDALEKGKAEISAEQQLRYIRNNAESQINNLIVTYAAAIGRKDGDAWVAPTGAHDSYGAGMIVTHRGAKWVSLLTGNVWEPGTSGWREIPEDGTGYVLPFRQPTGAHDAYLFGEQVEFEGVIYRSLLDSNVHSPADYPSGWEVVELESPVAETPEPEPEVPAVPEFVQPTGGHDSYKIGDQVLFNGVVYESVIDNNAYSPGAYPAGWKTV